MKSNQKIQPVKINDLYLWTENPRDPVDLDSSDYDIIKRAIQDENSKWDLPKLIKEMGSYYDFSEIPTVVKVNEKFVVYDGNRRIAILKYLQNKQLYFNLGGGLFFNDEPKELRELEEISCNVCDKETALTNIERKHINNGSWKELERDYFLHVHRNVEKSLFLRFDEQTGIISKYPEMNKRFVKDEVLTEKNLAEIGIRLNQEKGLVSNYQEQDIKEIIFKIVSLIENKSITTRENRGELKGPLLEKYPDLKDKLDSFDEKKETNILKIVNDDNGSQKSKRKTPITKDNNILFGKTLSLQSGAVNDLYRAISEIYDRNKFNDAVLPIIGMSLRLIIEVAARVYYRNIGENEKASNDQACEDFLKEAKKNMEQSHKNSVTLTGDWISSGHNLKAILDKYAHGNITSKRGDILKNSFIVADILEYHFKK
jgi:hypothetical protein